MPGRMIKRNGWRTSRLAIFAIGLALTASAPATTLSAADASTVLAGQSLSGPRKSLLIPVEGSYLPPNQSGSSDPNAPRNISPRRGNSGQDATAPYGGGARNERYRKGGYASDGPPSEGDRTYSSNEIVDAGHHFFGTISSGLASVVEHAFAEEGRPDGYILGEEAGGAFVAGLRYGEGTLHSKIFGTQKVYWQGPSIGYDVGGDGSKTMVLVYHLAHPNQMFHRFAGVDGSAYFVGGVGMTFQRYGDVVLAPIRSGVGLRLGANVGYLKYTSEPTWNPF
jgi:hypothetical protein